MAVKKMEILIMIKKNYKIALKKSWKHKKQRIAEQAFET
jgi:hypothetical protein